MRLALIAAAAATLLSPAASAAAFGYDLCGLTTQTLKSRASDFAPLRGEMRQAGEQLDMKEGGGEYAMTLKPGEDAECGVLARGVDSFGEAVLARIFCTLGSPRSFTDASTLYNAAIEELRLCYAKAKFNPSKFGSLEKPGDLVRWSTEIEDPRFALVLSMSALPTAGRTPAEGQFTVRYQLWNIAGPPPAKKPAVAKAPAKKK